MPFLLFNSKVYFCKNLKLNILQHKIDVCLSPAIYNSVYGQQAYTVVITDVLRATTTAIAALDYGISAIIPVKDLEEAKEYKRKGYVVAAERDGLVPDFADTGNSPFDLRRPEWIGKTLVHTTTNGTLAINMAKHQAKVVLGAFVNISSLSKYLLNLNSDVLVLCAGWRDDFCLEDTIFAGALAEQLLESGKFFLGGDAASAALSLWREAQPDRLKFLDKATHINRLRKLGLQDSLLFAFTNDVCKAVPVLYNNQLIDALNLSKSQ